VLLSTVYTFTISFVIEEQAVFPVEGKRSPAYDLQKRNAKLDPRKFPILMDKSSLDRPMLVFDGECPFCRVWVEYWKGLTGEQILYEPFQEVGSWFPQISQGDFASAVKLVLLDGEVRSGARASSGICRGF
jgi:hypothetical protein